MPQPTIGRILRLAAPLLGCAALAAPLAAQADSVTVQAAGRYHAGGPYRMLFGRDYRDLWTATARVPVLDPRSYAGGLTVLERGGGLQTRSLRLRGADGQEWVFRSVDKDQTGGLPDDIKNTLVDRIAQDQVSSKHPAAAPIVASLMESAGVLHATPVLYVMPDDPALLGEHRAEFAGMLGMMEVRPNDAEDGWVPFADADEMSGTEGLLEELEEDPRNRVDSRAYLAARLMDFLVGDWDRHPDQWRWAGYDHAGGRVWRAIPRDRDNAFSDYDGLALDVARRVAPRLVEFRDRYPSVFALSENAQTTDRPFLADLPRAAFDSTALTLQRRITDAVIDDAVAQGPPEYRALRGAELARALRARRDALPAIAAAFYTQLASEVDVQATDQAERAEVARDRDGSVEVRLFAGDAGGAPYFQRRFLPEETNEVRVYLRGGDDVAVVRGSPLGRMIVRVVGGGGADRLEDLTGGGRVRLYDEDPHTHASPLDRLITRPYEPLDTAGNFFVSPPRDWGSTLSWLSPSLEWRQNVGPVLGAGPQYVRYGFRRDPHALRASARLLYAPLHARFGVELEAERRRESSTSRAVLLARASQLHVTRFHGFGNETGDDGPDARFKVLERQLLLAPRWVQAVGRDLEIWAGPLLKYTDPELEPESPALLQRPLGTEAFGQAAAVAGLDLDTRDAPYPTRGVDVALAASAYPEFWGVESGFGGIEGSAATYLGVPLPLRDAVLALRLGGRALLGDDFPIQEAAFIGGAGSVRGYPLQRFLGESAAFGSAELRAYLGRFNFISRGDLGALALYDVGRVWFDGESSDTWHQGFGGGIWVGVLERSRVASLVYAYGEEHSLYFTLGLPF